MEKLKQKEEINVIASRLDTEPLELRWSYVADKVFCCLYLLL